MSARRDPPPLLGQHAIVIGGSMAGLVTARVLSERFARVSVLDRDALPLMHVPRKGVPQGWHGHGVLASGLRGLTRLFPTLNADLVAAGAIQGDIVGSVRWFQHGRYKARFNSGLEGVLLSRPLLEGIVRRHVLAIPNVDLVAHTHVVGLSAEGSRVTGVRLRRDDHGGGPSRFDATSLADLVVDASGRASRSPEWLEQLGYERPRVDEVRVGLGYTTRTYVRRPEHLDGDLGVIIAPTPPHQTRAGFAFVMEGDRWIVSMCGWTGDHAEPTPEGFLAFAKSLPRPDVYDLIRDATPLTDPVSFAFPANIRRRYERMTRLPEGYLAIGDAIACFNPIYGQGMSVATLEAIELETCLDEPQGLARLGQRFFTRAARVVDTPWTIAVGGDFAFKGVTGARPAGTSIVNWYMDHVHDAASTDRAVCRAFFDVANLLAPPPTLFRPSVVARVLSARLQSGFAEFKRELRGGIQGGIQERMTRTGDQGLHGLHGLRGLDLNQDLVRQHVRSGNATGEAAKRP
jgi:2-polyprenyl-6-methoxyphenol hydroxylase-like FAD-dependent oxidoreductase